MNYITSPRAACISINNLRRVMPAIGMNPVITHNDGKMIKILGESKMQTTLNERLYTAEEMATKLGISTSYVYAKLNKLEAVPLRKEGKTAYYGESLLDKMGKRVRRQRRTAELYIKDFKTETKEQLLPVPQPEVPVQEGLLERVANLEKKLERLQSIEKSLDEIKKILGTL